MTNVNKSRALALGMLALGLAHAPQSAFAEPASAPVSEFKSADVDGRTLRYKCGGQGFPTVIVEQGGGISLEMVFAWSKPVGWAYIFPAIAKVTRMCVYDRADLGSSSKTEGWRTSQDTARELHAMLAKIGEKPPYVMAGQSLGGINVRVFAREYPSSVAGLLLIDTVHHDWYPRIAEILPPERPDESEEIRAHRYRPSASILGENIDVRASLELLRKSPALGDMPLIVLTRNPNASGLGPASAEWETATEALHQRSQLDLAKISTNSKHAIASKAGHNIQLEEPQLVIDSILELVQRVRRESSGQQQPPNPSVLH